MKKLIICCIIMVVLCQMSGQDLKTSADPNNFLGKAFSYGLERNINLKTEMSPDMRMDTDLFSQDKVTSLKVVKKKYGESTGEGEKGGPYSSNTNEPDEITYIYTYEHGRLLADYYSHADADPNRIYEYDNLRRLIKSGNYTYSYPEIQNVGEMERTVYYVGDFKQTQKVRLIEDGYEVYTIGSTGSETFQKFIYEGEFIKEIIESRILNLNGRIRKAPTWNWSFKYKNGLQKEIICVVDDDIRSITKILEYDGQNIAQVEELSYRDGLVEFTKIKNYSNYDEYGNWHDAEIYNNAGELSERVHRVIEYD